MILLRRNLSDKINPDEDLIKKLEKVRFPEIKLKNHEHRLKMALLNSGYFQKKNIMPAITIKKLAPVGIFAAIALAVVFGTNLGKYSSTGNLLVPPEVYAKEMVSQTIETLKGKSGVGIVDPATGVFTWKEPDQDGNVLDAEGRIIFTTAPSGQLVAVPRATLSPESALEFEKKGGYPDSIFNDMVKAKNTAYYYIVVKTTPLTQNQIDILRESGVRMVQSPNQNEIDMLKNMNIGISDEKNVYSALIEEDQVEQIRKLDFVVSVSHPSPKDKDYGLSGQTDYPGSIDETMFTKDSLIDSFREAQKSKDLTYLGNKVLENGERIKVLRFTDNKGNITVMGINENNLPVIRLAYNKNGTVMFGAGNGAIINNDIRPREEGVNYGKIDPNSPRPDHETQIKYWTENLEQPTDEKIK